MIDVESKFLEFFQSKDHIIDNPGNIVSGENSSTMFNVAGMQQYINYFTQKEQSPYQRVTTSQPCIRVGGKHCDLNGIGKTKFHITFFKMLGNFSFQDYFKEEAIMMAFEFLKTINIDFNHIYVTVYPDDIDAYNIWLKYLDKSHIFKLEENIWQLGEIGPYGFCSEIFYDIYEGKSTTTSVDNMLEIWNIVFMEYFRDNNGTHKLSSPFIDTGMGLERITSVVEKTFDVFQTTIIKPIYNQVKKHNGDLSIEKLRVYTDHIRTACILIDNNVRPGSNGTSYVLRTLIRKTYRAQNHQAILDTTIKNLKLSDHVKSIFLEEIENLKLVIETNKKYMLSIKNPTEQDIFHLKDTYGIPYEVSLDFFNSSISKDTLYDVENKFYDHINNKNKIDITHNENTKILYYDHLSCTGTIEEITYNNNLCYIVTDQTCFYPCGGGQPGDCGYFLTDKNEKIVIEDTIKKNVGEKKVILHITKQKHQLCNGDKVTMYVDQQIRQARTRAHSSVHITGDLLESKYPLNITSTSVKEDSFRLDIESNEEININKEEINILINQYIVNNYSVEKKHENLQETNASRLKGVQYDTIVRTVKMGPQSYQLCGGTHVNHTGEIGSIIIDKISNLGVNKKRLFFLCGLKSIEKINQLTNMEQEPNKKTTSKLNIKEAVLEVYHNEKSTLIEMQGKSNDAIKHYKKNYNNKPCIYVLNHKNGNNLLCFNCNHIIEKIPYISKGGNNNMYFLLTQWGFNEIKDLIDKTVI